MSLDQAYDMGLAADMIKRVSNRGNGAIANMEEAIHLQAARIRELELLLADARVELVSAKLGCAGYLAQAAVLKGELQKAAPENGLFKKAGGVYEDGKARTNLNVYYDNAVDAKAFEMKLPLAGKAYRRFAK
jgi:hypothetical protein